MKTRRAARRIRRVRTWMAWGLILSVAVAEFWMMGQLAVGVRHTTAASRWQTAAPVVEGMLIQ